MNFAWMRRIDLYAGKPLVRFIGLFIRRPKSLYGDVHPASVPERIICAKFIGLGSVVLSLPLLKALREKGAKVAFWSFPGQAELARLSGHVDEVWVIKPTFKEFLPSLIKSLMQARKFRANAYLDLEPTANFTALLGVLSGVRHRVGFMSAKPFREGLFTHLVALTSDRHMIENCLTIGRSIGLAYGVTAELPEPPEFLQKIQNVVPIRPKAKDIIINVNSSDLSWHRMWPEKNWISVCLELLKDPTVRLIFPGTKSEAGRVRGVIETLSGRCNPDDLKRITNVSGQTTLPELMKLLQDAALVMSVDSGIMHLAAWMNVPLIGFFGPETPSLFGPKSNKAKVLWAQLPCSPCLSVAADKITQCRDNQCMKRISAELAIFTARTMLYDVKKTSAAI